jgi:predicted SAM-dependent methyltransferase
MTAVETAKGWTEWLDFMVKVHGYVPWDVRLVKQFEFLQDFTARLPPGGRVLDVGAGQCEMRRFFEGFRYVGADAAWGDPAWDYSHLDVIANVQRLPFPAGAFDGAINLWVAEHVRDPVAMAAEIGRVLKPGGWFLTFLPFVVHEHQTPHDYYRFTRFGAAALLEDNGFDEIRVVPDSSVGFAVAYEGVKHLNSLRNAAGLPPDWKKQLDVAADLLTRLAQHFAQERQFPAEAPALSYLAMGRKSQQDAAAPPSGATPVRRQAPRRLNVGCGNQRKPGWIGIDKVQTPAVDIVRDLARGLPFEDSSVDEIYCDNVLEHIGPPEDFVFVLNEFYRVLKPGGLATIIVPDARSQGAWQDPTHVRAFVPRSALYWNQDLPWPKLYGITANFDVAVEEYGDRSTEAFLKFTCRARPR